MQLRTGAERFMKDENLNLVMDNRTRPGLAAMLRPRSIAILGASDRSRWSSTALANLVDGGFAGEAHLINRRGGLVHGRAAATSCVALGQQVDLGIVMVPGGAVLDAITDLAEAGGRAAVVLTAGFAETGPAGAATQAKLVRHARQLGVRLLGPNCLGFINFIDHTYAWTTPVQALPHPGHVAIVSQSGATAYFLSTLAYKENIALSHVVSTGNEADLDCSEVIEYLLDDPDTKAIATFVETIREPAIFLRAARLAMARGKPIVVLKVGASEVTAKSAQAHTGALVGDDRVFDGICAQYGLIRVRSIEELLSTADIIARTGPLRPGGLGIVSNSGGISEIAADTAHGYGIDLPALSEAGTARVQAALPDLATAHNPVDVSGAIEPAECETILRAFGAEPDYAAILCPWYEIPTSAEQMSERLTQLHHHLAIGLNEAPIPGLLVSYTNTVVNDFARAIIAETGAPYFACGLDRAVRGLAHAFRWSARLREGIAPAAGPDVVQDNSHPQDERTTLAYLAGRGVPVIPSVLAGTAEQALQAAAGMGGPVVLKISSPDILHKSDIGGVALNLEGEAAIAGAFARVMDSARAAMPQAQIDGVLVAPMRERGVELLVGITRDPQWGPVLAVGLGGIWVETLRDVALRLLPVSPDEVLRMLDQLRGRALLDGQRGVPPADRAAVAKVIAAIGDAALGLGPALETLEVNPLWVRGDRVEALDALAVW